VRFSPPPASASPTDLADWLELTAVSSADGNASAHDLISAIRRSGTIDATIEADELDSDDPLDAMVEREADDLEGIADSAVWELENRSRLLGAGYPFTVTDGVLQVRPDYDQYTYVFLVALSSFGHAPGWAPESGAELFEGVCQAALVEYLGGAGRADSYHFGFPRRNTSRNFRSALDELCSKMGEGGGCKIPRPLTSSIKDAKLDIAAWIPFSDGRTDHFTVFAQCATGSNWKTKLLELVPLHFWNTWLQEPPGVYPLPAFFLPRHLTDDEWRLNASGGSQAVFDRVRITQLLPIASPDGLGPRVSAWNRAAATSGQVQQEQTDGVPAAVSSGTT